MMLSHVYSLVAKVHAYQRQPERFRLVQEAPLRIAVDGVNGDHLVVLRDGRLGCDCDAAPALV